LDQQASNPNVWNINPILAAFNWPMEYVDKWIVLAGMIWLKPFFTQRDSYARTNMNMIVNDCWSVWSHVDQLRQSAG
jgi:hypothetical protein